MGIFEFEGGYPILNLFFVLYAAIALFSTHLALRSGAFSGLSEVPKSLLVIFLSSGFLAGIVSVVQLLPSLLILHTWFNMNNIRRISNNS